MLDIKSSSIIYLYDCMMNAKKNNNDGSYNWLLSKCKNQSSLCSIERKSTGIISMTLNTFKKYSNDNIDGGFEKINTLRKEIYNKYNPKVKTANKKENLKKKNLSVQKRLENSERQRAILLRAYKDLNQITLDAICNSPQYDYAYKKHSKMYYKYFNLSIIVDNE